MAAAARAQTERAVPRPSTIENCRSLTQLLQRPQSEEDDFAKFGLTQEEINEARSLFKQRLLDVWKDAPPLQKQRRQTLRIVDMDLVIRQLRVFVSTRFIWALFLEIDENNDGTVDQEEFMMMVAKLRGRRPLSSKFHLGTLPRKTTEQYSNIFSVLDQDSDGLLDQEGMIMGVQQLNPSVSIDHETFRGMLAGLDGAEEKQFGLSDFLVLQAKLRRRPVAIESALLSFTPEERDRFEKAFAELRDPRPAASTNPQELRALMNQLGFAVSLEQIIHILDEFHVERGHPLEAQHFLYMLASVGAGSCVRQRPIIWPGASYEDASEVGFPLDELWDLGYDDLKEITRVGYSAAELYKNELANVAQLRQLGFRAAELRKSGISARELHGAGFSLAELRNAGFSVEVLRQGGKAKDTEK